ncbi:hypothetical protein LguiA_012793 [Lonicera macranthoides]
MAAHVNKHYVTWQEVQTNNGSRSHQNLIVETIFRPYWLRVSSRCWRASVDLGKDAQSTDGTCLATSRLIDDGFGARGRGADAFQGWNKLFQCFSRSRATRGIPSIFVEDQYSEIVNFKD